MGLKAQDLKNESVEALREREIELSGQLFALRTQKVTGQMENPAKIREAKRDRARVLTILRQRTRDEEARKAGEEEAK